LFLPSGRALSTITLWVGISAGFIFILTTVLHLIIVWFPLSQLLQHLAETPLAPAFERMPPKLRSLGKLHVFDPPDESLGEVLAAAGHKSIWMEAAALSAPAAPLAEFENAIDAAPDPESADMVANREESLTALINLVRLVWCAHPELIWSSAKPDVDAKAPPGGLERWLRQAEEVVAVEVTRYVDWVLRHMRRIAMLLLGLLLFTTALLEVLPFPFHATLTTLFVVTTILGVGTVVLMMVQLAQDDVLSRITGSDPGRLNWNAASLVSVLVYIAIPLVALLSTEVAPVGETLFGWLGGLLRILSTT
jgi:hypothetical protein